MNKEAARAIPSEEGIDGVEVSVVIPCLNEPDTLGKCIETARRALHENNISGEILVADNGSTDSSPAIAGREQARVVPVKERGYGSALMGNRSGARPLRHRGRRGPEL